MISRSDSLVEIFLRLLPALFLGIPFRKSPEILGVPSRIYSIIASEDFAGISRSFDKIISCDNLQYSMKEIIEKK